MLVALQIGRYSVAADLSLQGVGDGLARKPHLQQLVVVDSKLDGVALLQPVKARHVDVGVGSHNLAYPLCVLLNLRIVAAADANHNGVGRRRAERDGARVNDGLRQIFRRQLVDALLQMLARFDILGYDDELRVVVTRLHGVDNEHKARSAFADVG